MLPTCPGRQGRLRQLRPCRSELAKSSLPTRLRKTGSKSALFFSTSSDASRIAAGSFREAICALIRSPASTVAVYDTWYQVYFKRKRRVFRCLNLVCFGFVKCLLRHCKGAFDTVVKTRKKAAAVTCNTSLCIIPGTSYSEVLARARACHQVLRNRLPGYLFLFPVGHG